MKIKLLYFLLVFFALSNIFISINILPFARIALLVVWLFLPGIILIPKFNRNEASGIIKILYIIGLSISFLMFGSLAINVIGKLIGIERPLDKQYLIIGLDAILLAILAIRWRVISANTIDIKYIMSQILKYSFMLVLPLITSIGTLMLNATGNSSVLVAVYLTIGLSISILCLLKDKISTNTWSLILYIYSISVLLSGWLRSNFVSGVDTISEYQISQFTHTTGYWSIHMFKDAYNACLSVGLLPHVFSVISGLDITYVYKLVFPLMFSLLPVIIFYTTHLLIKNNYYSFLSAMFFVAQPAFTTWMWIPIRQEIAFIFLGLVILLSLEITQKRRSQLYLFSIFSISLIVSHYSTTYITLFVFVLMNIIYFVNKAISIRKISHFKIKVQKVFPNIQITLLLMAFTYIWYAQLTYGFNGFTGFVKASIEGLPKIFTNKVQTSGQSFFDQFRFYSSSKVQKETSLRYTAYVNNLISDVDKSVSLDKATTYLPEYTQPRYSSIIFNVQTTNIFIVTREIFKLLGKLIIGIGAVIFFRYYINKKANKLLIITSFGVIVILAILPYITVGYDLVRSYQQVLIYSSILSIYTFYYLSHKYKYITLVVALFISGYFLFLSKTAQQMVGGSTSVTFNNFGPEYDMYYVHTGEVVAGNWLSVNKSHNVIYSDRYASNRLRIIASSQDTFSIKIFVIPQLINKSAYVYLSNTNYQNQIALDSYENNLVSYQYPNTILTNNKNLVYSNDTSAIYK